MLVFSKTSGKFLGHSMLELFIPTALENGEAVVVYAVVSCGLGSVTVL